MTKKYHIFFARVLFLGWIVITRNWKFMVRYQQDEKNRTKDQYEVSRLNETVVRRIIDDRQIFIFILGFLYFFFNT